VAFALRRVRARPLSSLALVLALAAAGALLGWSSLTAATSQEQSVRVRMNALTPGDRSFQVVYFTVPPESDVRAQTVRDVAASFADVAMPAHRIRISHSIEPGDPRGTRIVLPDDLESDVVVDRGRLPATCGPRICETLALTGDARVGTRLRLSPETTAVVVGRGSLRPGLLRDRSELERRALLVRSLSDPLQAVVAEHGSTVITTAELDPKRVHAFAVPRLQERFRVAIARLESGDSLVRATAPIGVLRDLAERGTVARERLLIVAGEGAALIVAFAAFLAIARRREAELVDDQLTSLGAARGQALTARAAEVVIPGMLGTLLALVGIWLAALVVAHHRGLPFEFVRTALPFGTTLAMVGVGLGGALLLVASLTPRGRPRFGVGALELAAAVALGLIVWQMTATGALSPDQVARNGNAPVVLLAPALVFFAAGVVLLRLVPAALRLGARAGRRSPFVRLAFVTAARNPAHAAAATTFLAVALGSSLFSLNYRATIDRQARDQAQFTVGANWRVTGRGLDAVGFERSAPALRLDGAVNEAYPSGAQLPVRVLALPAARIAEVAGWRSSFSDLSRSEIARRLRPTPVRLTGPALARDARALRVWGRAQTDYPRLIVLHFLLPNQRFVHLRLGQVWRHWQLLRVPVLSSLRGARLVGVQYEPSFVPISFQYDPQGFVDLGSIEQQRPGGWSSLPSIGMWNPTVAPDGTSGDLFPQWFRDAPVAEGVRFEISGTRLPLVHPPTGLQEPLSGFQTGTLPTLVGGPVDAQSVDGLLTLVVAGKAVPVHVIGTAQLFPSIVNRPHDFVVVDYDTLFAALNADQPGIVVPSEAWSFESRRPAAAALGAGPMEKRLRGDPLAAGTRRVLGVVGVLAALLGFVGLVLATRSALASERLVLAEYEALGVAPRTLRRSAQLRIGAVSALGIVAGLVGGVLGVRLIAAFVAVTGTARRPLPPIVSVVAWAAGALVLAALIAATLAAAWLVAGRALREPAARRLRA
jgi:hypothetical protein